MTQCEICEESGQKNCKHCSLANPCIGCKDYDETEDKCKSNGGCADMRGEEK